MVRTVKSPAVRALQKGESAVVMPGLTRAEPWEAWILGGPNGTECVQVCATPKEIRLRKNTTLALPVSQVFCLPLWLNETDPKQFATMIPLQLELRGLQPRGKPGVTDFSVVATEGTRTLVIVGVLPAMLDPDLQTDTYQAFDLSARYLPFPENSVTIWREQDQLAFAVTRGSNLAYFHSFGEGSLTSRMVQDINCLLASLTLQGIVGTPLQVVIWVDISVEEKTMLQSSLRLSLTQAQRPNFRAPSPAWKLTPGAVGDAQRSRQVWRTRKLVFLASFALYLIVVALLLAQLYLLSSNVNKLRQWQTDNAQALALVHETQAAWKDLHPVVDENNYPLELLHEAAASIPADQLNLTLFEAKDDHLLIKGEAKNVAAAFQFLDKLKADPFFSGYTWDMPQPHLLPNDLAQLQIEGTRSKTN